MSRHAMTLDSVDVLSPQNFTADWPNRHPGLPIGFLGNGTPLQFNPWAMKQAGVINALVFMIYGELGYGKTALAKELSIILGCYRNPYGKPMRLLIDNEKINFGIPEYLPLIEELGGSWIDLAHSGLNIIDPQIGLEVGEVVSLLETVLRIVREEKLDVFEISILRAAYENLIQTRPPEAQNLDQLIAILNNSENLQPTHNGLPLLTSAEKIRASCESLAHTIARLTNGDLDFVFSSNLSPFTAFQSQHVAIDSSGLINERARSIAEVVLWRWRTSRNPALVRDVFIGDENQKRWADPFYAESMYTSIKQIRTTGGCVILSTQHESDYGVRSPFAAQMLNDVTGYFFLHTHTKEAIRLGSALRLSDPLVDAIQRLQKGQVIFYVPGQPPVFFEIKLLSDRLRKVCRSDQATEAIFRKE